jgi:5-methylcytosine-specific restriction endonuclease McrA
METLVLDPYDQPVNRVRWRRAVALWLNNKVKIIEEYADRVIRTAGFEMQMPAVVQLLSYFGRRQRGVRFSRLNILIRDKYSCQYCGGRLQKNAFTLDHVLPLSRGGKTTWENVVACCIKCNSKKKSRTPEEAGMPLRQQPVKPKSLPGVPLGMPAGDAVPEVWQRWFRSAVYWNVELETG